MTETEPKTRPTHVLEDPSAQAIARMYAGSYLDAAAATGQTEPLEEFTSFVDDVLKPNPRFEEILTSAIVHTDDKLGLIDRVVKPRASELFTNFLRVLARHDRLELLPSILGEAWREQEQREGKRRVTVKSAVSLDDETLKQIKDRLDAGLPFEPILIPEVDESLLGGLVIQVGDTVYDSSLRTRIRQLRGRLRERCANEIQSGRNRFSHSEGN